MKLPTLARAAPAFAIYLLLAFTTFGMALLWPAISAHTTFFTRRGTLRANPPDEAIAYVQQNVPAGARLLVYPYQPLYNFLTATMSPLRYDYLQPGMHSSDQLKEAVTEFAASKTEVVLLNLDFGTKVGDAWPSTPAQALAHDPMTDYIVRHYHPCRVLNTRNAWRVVYFVREGADCPSTGAQSSVTAR